MTRKTRSGRFIHLFGAFVLSQTGCFFISSTHVDGAAVEVPRCDPSERASLSARFVLLKNRDPQPRVAEEFFDEIRQALDETGMFSEVDFGGKHAFHLEIVADDESSREWSAVKVFVSGLSLGLIGYTTAHEYDFVLTLATPGRESQTLDFHRETRSVGGLLHGRVPKDYRAVPNSHDGYIRHLTEAIHAAIEKWKSQGLLCRRGAKGGSMGTSGARSRVR